MEGFVSYHRSLQCAQPGSYRRGLYKLSSVHKEAVKFKVVVKLKNIRSLAKLKPKTEVTSVSEVKNSLFNGVIHSVITGHYQFFQSLCVHLRTDWTAMQGSESLRRGLYKLTSPHKKAIKLKVALCSNSCTKWQCEYIFRVYTNLVYNGYNGICVLKSFILGI